MKQINNSELVNVVEKMKKLNSFQIFLSNRKKALKNFINNPTFSFNVFVKSSSGKKTKESRTRVLSIGSNAHNLLVQLHQEFENIVTCDSVKLNEYKDEFKKYEPLGFTKPEFNGFAKKIISVLDYSELRSGDDKLLFEFYKMLGVKVCVYCNSQHVILLEKSKLARLQADHNLPKIQYPWFSITLSNLYPSCNNCNHLKGEKEINYQLYYDKQSNSKIKFKVPEKEIALFNSNSIKENELKIDFDQAETKLNTVLDINGIYENHKDYAADLMRKHKAYTDEYLISLQKSFNSIFGANTSQLNRMIYGSSLDEADINQRTFSKLLFDINTQLIHLKKIK